MGKYQAYPEYKDSQLPWLGAVPAHWTVCKLKHGAEFQVGWTPPTGRDENFVGENLWANISDIRQKVVSDTAKRISDAAAAAASMSITPAGSLLYSFKLSVGAVAFAGRDMYTNEAIASFLKTEKVSLDYLYYALPKFVIENASVNIYGAAILNQELIKNAPLVLPTPVEQGKIAAFLDHETAKIDRLIARQERLIELLKEKRQAVISHAVTKGLNPDAPMKDSGVEWLGEVPAHWEVKKLRRCVTEHKQGFYSSDPYVDVGIKLLRITDFRELGGVSFEECPLVEPQPELGPFTLKKGDFVFARTGGAGSFALIEGLGERVIFASYLIRFRFNRELERCFLRYCFLSDPFQVAVKQKIHGGVNQNLHAEDIKEQTVAVPPKHEQDQIVKFLDDATTKYKKLIAKATHSIELLQEHRAALISAAVTGKIDVRNFKPANA